MSHSTSPNPGSQPVQQASMRTPLGRVRGRGASGHGAHHWWMQRVTSVALLPLTLWFVAVLATNAGMTHAEAVAWIGHPFNAVLLIALIALTFHHTASGLQVILEDYVNNEALRRGSILLVQGVSWLLGIAAVLAVVRIAV